MSWKITFYSHSVMKDIQQWPKSIQAKFTWIAELLEEFGPKIIGMPHVKSMGQGLFEIRVKTHEGLGRIFFCTMKGKEIIILSGFIKKTQKTPIQELSLAKKRMNEVQND